MYCLKCGKDTKGEAVFCQSCLEVMDKYPVKPDVHVQLPNRANAGQKRSGKKRIQFSADEQLVILRRRMRKVVALVLLLIILLSASVAAIIHLMGENEALQPSASYTNSDLL